MAEVFARRGAVVTGASTGIGRALVLQLAARGARVVAAARSADKLRALAREGGEAVVPVAADITDEASVEALADAATRALGRIEILVNNAAVGYAEPFLAADLSHWRETIETNLVGTLLVTRAILPGMLEHRRGVVVNVGSSGASGWPYLTLYAATKAAVHAAAVSLDGEYRNRGVRVLSIEITPTLGTGFGSRFDPRYLSAAVSAWTVLGIPWNPSVSAEESAQKILRAIEDAL